MKYNLHGLDILPKDINYKYTSYAQSIKDFIKLIAVLMFESHYPNNFLFTVKHVNTRVIEILVTQHRQHALQEWQNGGMQREVDVT